MVASFTVWASITCTLSAVLRPVVLVVVEVPWELAALPSLKWMLVPEEMCDVLRRSLKSAWRELSEARIELAYSFPMIKSIARA
jgi:hypothetical protein